LLTRARGTWNRHCLENEANTSHLPPSKELMWTMITYWTTRSETRLQCVVNYGHTETENASHSKSVTRFCSSIHFLAVLILKWNKTKVKFSVPVFINSINLSCTLHTLLDRRSRVWPTLEDRLSTVGKFSATGGDSSFLAGTWVPGCHGSISGMSDGTCHGFPCDVWLRKCAVHTISSNVIQVSFPNLTIVKHCHIRFRSGTCSHSKDLLPNYVTWVELS